MINSSERILIFIFILTIWCCAGRYNVCVSWTVLCLCGLYMAFCIFARIAHIHILAILQVVHVINYSKVSIIRFIFISFSVGRALAFALSSKIFILNVIYVVFPITFVANNIWTHTYTQIEYYYAEKQLSAVLNSAIHV